MKNNKPQKTESCFWVLYKNKRKEPTVQDKNKWGEADCPKKPDKDEKTSLMNCVKLILRYSCDEE